MSWQAEDMILGILLQVEKANITSGGEDKKSLQTIYWHALQAILGIYIIFVLFFLKGACILFERCELLDRSDLNYSLWFSFFLVVGLSFKWLFQCSCFGGFPSSWILWRIFERKYERARTRACSFSSKQDFWNYESLLCHDNEFGIC